jgi:gamma-glutamyltranspeptidase/glutathione hydrolase
VNVLDFGMPIDEAVAAPRHHHQWFPDEIRFEGAKDYPALIKALNNRGHRVVWTKQGDAHSILVDPRTGAYLGAADHRISGKAWGY